MTFKKEKTLVNYRFDAMDVGTSMQFLRSKITLL